MIGKVVNHYKIVSRLGKGGMGEVYAAEDTKLGRKVALKVLPAEMASNPERRARFEREAKAVASLNHPNIVTIHSVEEAEGIHFLTMELVDGQSLSALIPPHGLPLTELLDRGIALADAVSAAHKLGITHRDLKPDNIMIGADGRLKVLDFGLAKLQESATDAGGTLLPTRSVTAEGKILGTVSYMSPEQAEGKTVDARSDVFSMGIILYQMATGRRPFQGDTAISTLSAILKETPQPIHDLNHALPRHLGRVVGHCLAKDPDRRYQSSLELRRELEGLREESESGEMTLPDGLTAPAKAASGSKWIGLGLAAVAIIVVALVATRFLPGTETSAPPIPSAAANMQMTQLTTSGEGAEGAISPDGTYVAFLERADEGHSLWVSHVTTGSKVQIVDPSPDFFMWDPTFSPQSDYIFYCGIERGAGLAKLYRVPVLGGNVRKIADGVVQRISFSPNGERFVFNREEPGTSSLVVSNLDGSNPNVIATRTFPSDFDDPSWSPDGTTIAVAASTLAGGPQANIVLVPADGGGAERHLFAEPWSAVGEVAWYSDGSGLVFDGNQRLEFFVGQLWEVSYPRGEARRITNDLNLYAGVTVDAAGKNLATTVAELSSDIWIVEPDGSSDPMQLTRTGSAVEGFGLNWTPDGGIVFGATGGGKLDLEIMDADGGNRKKITADAGLNGLPSVTPDGEWLVFLSTRAETINLWRSDLEGEEAVQLTFGELDDEPSLSPDGRWVLFVGGDGRNVMKVSIEGGEPVRLNDKHSQEPFVSPDGKLVAARTWDDEAKRWGIDILPFGGGEPIQRMDLPDGEYQWAPDGKSLTVSTDRAGTDNLFAHSLDGSAPRQLTDFKDPFIGSFAWSPDGKRVAMARGKFESDVVLLRNFR